MDESGRIPRVAMIDEPRRKPVLRPATLALAALATVLSMPLPARAGLGGAVTSIVDDGATMGAASVTSTATPSYVRHEITTTDGVRVREFAASGGTVFAVAFDGPTMPDLKAVLGTHYDSYVAAAKSRRGSHHVVSFASDDAVVTIMKMPRGFSGHARIPSATPAGVDVQTLR